MAFRGRSRKGPAGRLVGSKGRWWSQKTTLRLRGAYGSIPTPVGSVVVLKIALRVLEHGDAERGDKASPLQPVRTERGF